MRNNPKAKCDYYQTFGISKHHHNIAQNQLVIHLMLYDVNWWLIGLNNILRLMFAQARFSLIHSKRFLVVASTGSNLELQELLLRYQLTLLIQII